MGIQNIGLTKGHIHRLLPAEITEFPLSGVNPPPLALRRPDAKPKKRAAAL